MAAHAHNDLTSHTFCREWELLELWGCLTGPHLYLIYVMNSVGGLLAHASVSELFYNILNL